MCYLIAVMHLQTENSWRWQAPETITGAEMYSFDEREAVYTLGVVLWELCSYAATPLAQFASKKEYLMALETPSQSLLQLIANVHPEMQ